MNEEYLVKKKIKHSVTHQCIGGKTFIVDDQISRKLTPDEVFNRAVMGNFACANFVNRRKDFGPDFKHKLYYGKVDGLGYIVAEDEFEEE